MAGSFPQAGFYYQNIIAAQHILKLVDLGSNIHSIELDNLDRVQHIDDIIVTYKDGSIKYYQIKWSGNDNNSYTLYNLAISSDDSEKPLLEQLATGYARLPSKQNVEVILYTTRPAGNRKSKEFTHSLYDFLREVHIPYINGEVFGGISDLPQFDKYQTVLEKLFEATQFEQETEFCEFLHKLRFQLNEPSIEYQQDRLKAKLDNLGIERSLYDTLLNAVVEWSIPPRQIVTVPIALRRLGLSERFVDRVAHDFKVEENHYVENSRLFQQLDDAIDQLDNGFIFLEGPPGSGKSTALTMYQRQRDTICFIYYCYIPDEKHIGSARVEQETFLRSLCIGIQNAFPEIDFPQKYSQDYEHKLNLWLYQLSQHSSKVVLIVDGLDHVHRKVEVNELTEPLTKALSGCLPPNVLFIVSAQYIEALPFSVKLQVQESILRHIKIAKFSQIEVEKYLDRRDFQLSDGLLPLITEKSGGIPLYLHYIVNILQNSSTYQYELTLNNLPFLQNDDINSYHAYLYRNLSEDEVVTYALAILAYRKEYTDIDTLIEISSLMNKKVSRYQAEQIVNRIKHLLDISDAKSYAIYHNSFREFILRRTQFLHNDVNEALIHYYQANLWADETYRNYFRHLFELERYEQILQECNHVWLETCWRDFRPFHEININLDLAWEASIEFGSFQEFIRIAFLKYQLHLINFFVKETTDFKISQFLLEMRKPQKALRIVWDGAQLRITQQEFAEFVAQYFKLTGMRVPDRIAMVVLEQLQRPFGIKDLRIFSVARALYPGWIEHFKQVADFEWLVEDQFHRSVKKELSPEETRNVNTSIQIAMVEELCVAQDFNGLMQLVSTLNYEQVIRLYASLYGMQLLLEAGEVQDAVSLINKFKFSSMKRDVYNRIILQFAKLNELAQIDPFIDVCFLPPALFSGLIEKDSDYKFKSKDRELNNCLNGILGRLTLAF